MCDCDGEPPEFYDANIVRARKPHRCCECLSEIEPGEHYEHVAGKWQGDFATFKTCIECIELREALKLECVVHCCLYEDAQQPYCADNAAAQRFLTRRYVNLEAAAARRATVKKQ